MGGANALTGQRCGNGKHRAQYESQSCNGECDISASIQNARRMAEAMVGGGGASSCN